MWDERASFSILRKYLRITPRINTEHNQTNDIVSHHNSQTQPQQTYPKPRVSLLLIVNPAWWTQNPVAYCECELMRSMVVVTPTMNSLVLLSLSLSLLFPAITGFLRFFLCIHVVYNLFNLLSLFWLFCLGCPMWFTFQCIRDFSCNRQNIFLQNPIPAP